MNKNKKLWILLGVLFAVTLGTVLLSVFYTPDSARTLALGHEIKLRRQLQKKLGDAFSALSNGQHAEAKRLVNEIIGQQNDNIYAWSLKGLICYNSGRYRQAAAAYQKVLLFAPGNASGYNDLAMAQLALGDYVSAEFNLEKSLELNPMVGQPHVNLARIYYAKNDQAKALEHLKKAKFLLVEQFEFYVSQEMFDKLRTNKEFLALLSPVPGKEPK